jgi:antirestriction protein
MDPIRIYVASLSDYNAGNLHGVWIDLEDKDADDVHAEIQKMLAEGAPAAEEFAIHDHEGFGSVQVEEYESVETVVEVARLAHLHGEAYLVYLAHMGTLSADEGDFCDSYVGEYEGGEDVAMQLAEESGFHMNYTWPQNCIDWAWAWRELTFDGYWMSKGGYVFRS